MKYLKVFETETQQNEFINSADYLQPHVSCLEDGSNVKYNKYSNIEYEMLNTPLTFEALYDQTGITFYQSTCAVTDEMPVLEIEISTDNGNTWITKQALQYNSNGHSIALSIVFNAGEKVLVRGNNSAYGYHSDSEGVVVPNCSFFADSDCYVYGNIMSLIDKSNFSTLREVTDYAFPYLFSDYWEGLEGSWLLSHPNKQLLLPATILGDYCYYYMFGSCTNLISAPTFPVITDMGLSCCSGMFSFCSSLVNAPKLSCTALSENCYFEMFSYCIRLTTAPELPATMLANGCYSGMFQYCTSLTTAPELPATTLESSCYESMFQGCTSLTTAPELPATTLASNCYAYMFYDCTSLTTAPELPATTLVNYCYQFMFYRCTNINYIKAMFTTTPSNTYTGNWVAGVASVGTFVKNSEATWNVTGNDGVPTGWTVETYFDGILPR